MSKPTTIRTALERGYHLSRRADLKVGDVVEVWKAKCYRPNESLADMYDRIAIKVNKKDLEYISPDFA